MEKLKKILISYWPFAIFALIILFVCRNFLFKNGYILYAEFLSSTDYLFILKEFLKPWSDYSTLGHSNIGFPATYGGNSLFMFTSPGLVIPIVAILSLLQIFFGNLVYKFYILSNLIIPFVGMYFFARFWFKESGYKEYVVKSMAFIAGIIYTINPVIGERIAAGHQYYAIAYGILPIFLLFYFQSLDEVSKRKRIIKIIYLGLLSSALFWLMPHLFTLLLFPLGAYFFLFILGRRKQIFSFITIGALSLVIGFLLNIQAWLPAIFYSEHYPAFSYSSYILSYVLHGSSIYGTFDKVIALTNSTAIQNWLALNGYHNLNLLKLTLPIFGFLGAMITMNKRKTIFALFLAVSGIILGMGTNFPFKESYSFLFEHVFLFKAFRDPSKFVILYVFGLALLIPVFILFIARIKKNLIYVLTFLISLIILIMNPLFLTGNFGGQIIPFEYPKKYDDLANFLAKDKTNFRVIIYPDDKSISNYNWFPKIRSGATAPNVFSLFLPILKSLAVSNLTTTDYSSRYLDYIEKNLDKEWTVERLAGDRVKYIIVDPDMSGYEDNLSKLKNNPVIKKIHEVEGFDIFYVNDFRNEQIKKNKVIYYFGDIRGIGLVPPEVSLINLGQNPINILTKNYSSDILFYNSSLNDLFLTSLNNYRFSFFPEIRFDDGGSFSISGENLRSLMKSGTNFYNPEGIFSDKINKIQKKSHFKPGEYRIFLSALSYPEGADKVQISVGETSIMKKIEKKKEDTLVWIDFGKIKISNASPLISIQNLEQKYLIIDSMLIIPETEYAERFNKHNGMLMNKNIIELNETTDFKSLEINLNYSYVLSQSYSPYWDVCGNDTFLVNFYALGASCENDKKINPYFRPAKIYNASIIIEISLYALIILFLIKLSIKAKSKKDN